MLKTLVLSFVALHAVIGQPLKPDHKIPQETSLDSGDFSQQYEIKTSKSEMNSKDTVEITISGKNGNKIKGFMVQVRPEGSATPVGKFIVDPSDPIVATLDSGNGEKNIAMIKYSESPQKERDFSKVSMTWSPNGYKGKVHLVYNIMKTGWVARKSNDLTVN